MDHTTRPSCFVVGADSLLIECSEILLRGGFDIRGVITRAPRIRDWAASKGLPVIDLDADYRAALAEQPFDYLFSITHLELLPADVLALPSRGAINFHDGPLPAYAGLNAPVWALLNREAAHGITWHEMTAGVDEGRILAQQIFEISPDETALSLNTKCFEIGIETFEELAGQLRAGTADPRPQPSVGRSVYRRSDRPPAACVLDWNKPAVELEALVRALDFGQYPNPVGTPKIVVRGEVYAVRTARAVEADASSAAVGTVSATDAAAVIVECGEGRLAISGFGTLCGRPMTATQFAQRCALRVGDQLDVLDEASLTALTELNARLARSEPWWSRRLASSQPASIPYVVPGWLPGKGSATVRETISVPAEMIADADAALAAMAAFVARLTGTESVDIALVDTGLRSLVAGHEAFVARDVPVRFRFDAAANVAAAFEAGAQALAEVRKRGVWLRDLPARVPPISDIEGLNTGSRLPVAFVVEAGEESLVDGTAATFHFAADGSRCTMLCDSAAISADDARVIARQATTFLRNLAAEPQRPIAEHDILDDAERHTLLETWNDTAADYDRQACIHTAIAAQVERTPDAVAVRSGGASLSYRELDDKAEQLALCLRSEGVGPDVLVGLCVERGLDLAIAALGILKAGGAYVPLDPAYPAERLALMIEDSQAAILVTQQRLRAEIPHGVARLICLEDLGTAAAEGSGAPVGPANLAYVIYTSGSTGKPKGVMVEHRNVINFFRGMDDRVAEPEHGVWLAVTSLSFDISVLELLWTLSRGFEVVIHTKARPASVGAIAGGMDFGLFLWGNDDGPGAQKYRLMLEAAKFADRNGFSSISTPERHFHAFGGPFPNPSVTSAAIAAVTERIQIRSGSCVAPLHHPIRIAEEWAVVDNLSNGRVGLSFAAGWQPNDFVLAPANHAENKEVMFSHIDTVRRLWRGEAQSFEGPVGTVERLTLPRPVQAELPVWVTSAGNPETYQRAGAIGANVLTHLLGQSVEEVGEKIRIYRDSLEAHGFARDHGQVTLMLHAFVGDDNDAVRELVRQPMKDYLGASISLVKKYAWSFPAFKRPEGGGEPEVDLEGLTEEEVDAVLEHAFLRYFESSGLFGNLDTCMRMVEKLAAIGVNEVGCLIDYGVPTDGVLEMLPKLAELRERVAAVARLSDESDDEDLGFAAEVRRHGVTHLQCTPSMARMLLGDPQTRAALGEVRHLMLGGEALPTSLVRELAEVRNGTLTNMYGPTETTIWSSTQRVEPDAEDVPIGTPIANTQLYVLDGRLRPVPAGVPGELWIGGEGVVRGYWQRPELTAERFVANPFRPGERMYRTGDLARWRADGVMEFLGRTDHQVKLRGYRIELGEIEARIATDTGVRDVVVLAREDAPGDQRLVAYIVGEYSADSLRDRLRTELPEFMVPAHFIGLPALPQTPNGKVDRKALPAPEALAGRRGEAVRPEGELEERIASAWQQVLGIDEVGRTDNFFDIGGHSLLVVRLHRLVREVVDTPLQLTDLYRFPTIAGLAEHAASGGGTSVVVKQGLSRAQARRDARRGRRA